MTDTTTLRAEAERLAKRARHLAAEYRGSPLHQHREVSDVLSKLAVSQDALAAALAEAERHAIMLTRQREEANAYGDAEHARAAQAEAERDAALLRALAGVQTDG